MKNKLNHLSNGYHLFKNRRTVWTMLRSVWSGDFKMRIFSYLVLLGFIIYAIMPIDLLPDFIPVIGWVDDGIFLMLLIQQLNKELVRYNSFKDKSDVIILK